MKGNKEMEKEGLEKKSFEEPKLSFIEPKLTKHGDATKITFNGSAFNGGFFGSFDVP